MDTERYRRTERTRLRRLPERGTYDRATVHAILDEGFICHLGFVVDGLVLACSAFHPCKDGLSTTAGGAA